MVAAVQDISEHYNVFFLRLSFISIEATTGKAAASKAKPKAKPKGPSAAEMTEKALAALKDRKGNTMAAIRKYITENYAREINNSLLLNIKKYMENEFLADRLRMTNSEAKSIDFSKRFALMKWIGQRRQQPHQPSPLSSQQLNTSTVLSET